MTAFTKLDLADPARSKLDLSDPARTKMDLFDPARTKMDLADPACTIMDLSDPARTKYNTVVAAPLPRPKTKPRRKNQKIPGHKRSIFQ